MHDQCIFTPGLDPPNCRRGGRQGVSGQSLRLTSACNPDSEESRESRNLKASHGYDYFVLVAILLWPVASTAVELGYSL